MSFATKPFIDKIQDIGSTAVLGVDIGLVAATVLTCLVAGSLLSRAHVLLLLLFLFVARVL